MTLEPKSFLLTDRVAVVTGASAGIGRATALALAHFGAHVAVCDRDVPGLAALGRGVIAAELDVRDGDAVRAFAATVAEQHPVVHVLVNNAGGGFHAAFGTVSDKGQDALIRENFGTVTNCTRAFTPLMTDGRGSIVNITSIEAHRAGPGFAVYSAMKAGVASLTKSLALELGPAKIRINCVAPDVIPTPGIGEVPVKTPLPVAGHPDDIAASVVFLAGDGARFITGTTVHVDGGNLAAGGWHRLDDGSYTA
jgi:3-oxoacyl-[acyl-carrier protein] reductase